MGKNTHRREGCGRLVSILNRMWGLPEVGKTARGGKEEEKKKRSVRQHCFHDAPGADANSDDNDEIILLGGKVFSVLCQFIEHM